MRNIRFNRLLISGVVYRLHIIVIQTIFFWIITSEWKWAIGTSLAWNAINTVAYYNYHYWFARLVKLGIDTDETNWCREYLGNRCRENTNGNGLLIGRWQTLHKGHDWLIEQVRAKGLNPVLAIRDTLIGPDNPLSVTERKANIQRRYNGIDVVIIPDIKAVFYGRDVGYDVVELSPPEDIAMISGTKIRNGDLANR